MYQKCVQVYIHVSEACCPDIEVLFARGGIEYTGMGWAAASSGTQDMAIRFVHGIRCVRQGACRSRRSSGPPSRRWQRPSCCSCPGTRARPRGGRPGTLPATPRAARGVWARRSPRRSTRRREFVEVRGKGMIVRWWHGEAALGQRTEPSCHLNFPSTVTSRPGEDATHVRRTHIAGSLVRGACDVRGGYVIPAAMMCRSERF